MAIFGSRGVGLGGENADEAATSDPNGDRGIQRCRVHERRMAHGDPDRNNGQSAAASRQLRRPLSDGNERLRVQQQLSRAAVHSDTLQHGHAVLLLSKPELLEL